MNRRSLLLATPALTLPAIARAQGAFPDRPIRVVIGYPAGGGTDTVGRPIMQRLSEHLRVPVIVENRGGANGNIAMEYMTRVEPDGYTIFMGDAGNLGITHALYPNLPFDTQRDFVGVAQLTAGPVVLVIAGNVPASTLAEWTALLKARPDAFNFGSAGVGSGPHLFYESWRRAAGVSMTHVPYRGTGPALAGLLAGDVHMMIGNYGVFRGAHEAGRVKVLAISTPARHPNLPDIPTAREAGTDWGVIGFNGIIAPRRIPADRRQALEDGFRHVIGLPEIQAQLLSFGSLADFAPGAELDRRMAAERESWTRLVREANIQAE
ncbi:Bug family tripartite tricarboxylate transporter substrate binding protein [Roseococcus thiosulfatophilus]|uniref:Bug family tripartite tricarboxylate transporter substrate binding protein n=1 Tax=Roseococcus thiosulfatophilus TaxID=35813 RepID=UPI001A8FD95E|nr:tripartite tricarboxylate transporter substrate binding protein [Roseococcus thiosulfatophilus]